MLKHMNINALELALLAGAARTNDDCLEACRHTDAVDVAVGIVRALEDQTLAHTIAFAVEFTVF